MKRVLQIIDSMDRGGAQVFVMNLFRNIDREKIQFDFLVTTPKESAYDDEIKKLGGNIYHVSSRRKGILKNWKELKSFFRSHKYECIHFHTSCPSYMEPLIVAKMAGIKKIILHSHSSNGPKGLYHAMMRNIYRPLIKYFATNYFACSKGAAKWMYGNYIPLENIEIIANGIEIGKYKYCSEVHAMKRNELGIKENELLIGHVGRFSKVKNHDFLIETFKAINEKEKDTKLLLVGDGILLEEIKKKVQQMRLTENVIFLSNRDDIHELMQAMDVFILPSLYEGLPVTLVEAQASGLPCIVSNRVSSEIALTDIIEFVPLEANNIYWYEAVLSKSRNTRRIEYNDIVKKSGFNIFCVCQMIEKLYTEKM